MKLKYPILLLAFLSGVLVSSGQERLRRDQSFLGIHFDFHANPSCTGVGANTTPEMIGTILDMVHPDYIQVDCKGHPGYSSYPTEVGNPVPDIVGDPLAVWRKVTAERGVSLYLHYSGVWDSRAVELHPDWAVKDRDGNPSKTITSVFGPYVDKLLVPQLKELAGKYGVDGVWVDGGCWATSIDYGEKAVRLFKEQTGMDAPLSPEDPGWFEWKQFHREAFRNYLRHYISAVRSEYPDFQICSNWSYTHHMPEPVSAPMDFLSGDYAPTNSVNSARVAARYLSAQGIPWDLMAWSFSNDSKQPGQKPSAQLMREAAVTLSQGGGFQAYYTQNRDGSVKLEKLKSMADVAVFARARQPYCHHSVSVPQVAVLLSTYNYQHHLIPGNPGALFPNDAGGAGGVLECLLDSQYSVDLLGEGSLQPDMGRFPLIVIPECETLSEVFRDDLLEYVRGGGSLLVIGEEMSGSFSKASGISLQGDKWFTTGFGSGKIGFIPTRISGDYDSGRNPEMIRSGVKAVVGELFPAPLVELKSSPFVEMSVRKHDGKLQVHLVNTSGDHRHTVFFESIDPVRNIEVAVRLDREPERIVCQPDGRDIKFDYKNGKAVFRIDSLDIYDIIEIE